MITPKSIDPEASWIDNSLWEFRTARFTIALFAEDEDIDPADSFQFQRDIDFARKDKSGHWFCAVVAVYDEDGDRIGRDVLGGCSYGSFEEFYQSHRWQYQRAGARSGRWIKDCRSLEWKRAEKRRPRRPDGSRPDGGYFTDMVREAIREARRTIAASSLGARRA